MATINSVGTGVEKDWADALLWAGGVVPSATDTINVLATDIACIPNGYTVTVNAAGIINVADGAIIDIISGGTLNVAGHLNIAAGGQVNQETTGAATIQNGGVATVAGTWDATAAVVDTDVAAGGILTIISGGVCTCQALDNDGTVENQAGGQVIAAASINNAGTFTNAGTQGPGIWCMDLTNTGTIVNTGVWNGHEQTVGGTFLNAGTAELRGGLTPGVLNVTGEWINSGILTLTTGTIVITVKNGGTIRLRGGGYITFGNSAGIAVEAGGKWILERRESALRDSAGNNLVDITGAYGFSQEGDEV